MEAVNGIIIDETIAKRLNKKEEVVRFYGVKIGTHCQWVCLKLEEVKEKE